MRGEFQFIDLAELDRLRRTRLGARGYLSRLLPVVAEGALESTSVVFVLLHHAEGTCHHAIATAVANVGLNEDAAKLRAHDGAGRAGLQAAGNFAVLANV